MVMMPRCLSLTGVPQDDDTYRGVSPSPSDVLTVALGGLWVVMMTSG